MMPVQRLMILSLSGVIILHNFTIKNVYLAYPGTMGLKVSKFY